MYKVFEMRGNSAFLLNKFDNFEEAQDFIVNKVEEDVEELKKDDPEADESILWELAASYYSIQEAKNDSI